MDDRARIESLILDNEREIAAIRATRNALADKQRELRLQINRHYEQLDRLFREKTERAGR